MRTDKEASGHLIALITVVIWGTTFASTKTLLDDFTPLEILFFRFSIGLVVLWIIFPHRANGTNKQQELLFIGAGLCGVTLYFLFENIALTYTLTSNIAIIVSISPFFTALLSHRFLNERLKRNFFIGFAIAIVGIILINLNGSLVLKLDPGGDILALLAAAVWAIYSVITKKISQYGHNMIQDTRRIFSYGLLFMIPMMFILPFDLDIGRFSDHVNLFNILFLGLGASAMCFVAWNTSVKILGAAKTSVYIYLIPIVAVITAIFVLNETITLMAVFGAVLAISGLILSEKKSKTVVC